MSGGVRRVDLASELVAGFVAGAIAAFFVLVFVAVFFPTVFSSGPLGTVFGVLGRLDPNHTPLGKLLVVVGGGLGAYWRYVFTSRRAETDGSAGQP